jgi:pimeloyl-ACP methyl ester carboxylesterase
MKLRRVVRLALAYGVCGPGILAASIAVDAFLFRPIARAWPTLFPWSRELNALSLILAAIPGGAAAVWLAKDEKKGTTLWPAVVAAFELVVLLWLVGQRAEVPNPLIADWRGFLMAGVATVAGGSLLVKGRLRWLAWPALLIALVVGFGTVRYDYYELGVIIPSSRVRLWATLTVPGRRVDATHPAVLLVHDLGCHDRDETWGVNRPFREMAEHLAANGYAVLRYDKRGCGRSGGEFTMSSLDDFVQDATAAATFLAGRNEVDGRPAFALGHGFGGVVATQVAETEPDLFNGLLLVATSASPITDWLRAQHRYRLEMAGASAEAIEAQLADVDNWLGGVDSRRYLIYGDYFGLQGLSEELQAEQHITPLPPDWLRQAMAHDQAAALAGLPLPVLILNGEADWRVPPSEAKVFVDALEAADRSDWVLKLLPGVNHHLVAVDDMDAGFVLEQTEGYAEERHPVAPEVLNALVEWLDLQAGKE